MDFKSFSPKQLKVLCWWCGNNRFGDYDAIICDGAVRSGKTLCMGISFFAWSFYAFENASFAICGKTIRSLKRNVVTPIVPIIEKLGFKCELKISENTLTVTKDGRTNRFYLFGGKDESSAALIQGMTLSGVLFDEVALMPRSFVEQALARCSVNGSKFWFNCNPEYPQHWFYTEWISKRKSKNALYVHFTMEDNPSLSPQMINRYKSMYSGSFYKRFVEGKWVSVEGAVYPFMNKDMFVPVPDVCFKRYAVSCDYGTVNPASFGLWGEYDGIWYRIKEYYYDSRRENHLKTDEEHYQSLCELCDGINADIVVVDPSAASFIEVIKRHKRFSVIPAKNNVIDGIRNTATALKSGNIKICDSCADSMREFSLYKWSSGGSDAPVKENDHAMDDIRYFVSTVLDSTPGLCVTSLKRNG
ncbi:MAG: PBSX family phage terminase large subunit [Clostridiales bacterium]|nr:PBSX family phage terminase large subunit [Clostridiales bacterium]